MNKSHLFFWLNDTILVIFILLFIPNHIPVRHITIFMQVVQRCTIFVNDYKVSVS